MTKLGWEYARFSKWEFALWRHGRFNLSIATGKYPWWWYWTVGVEWDGTNMCLVLGTLTIAHSPKRREK